MTNYFSFLPLDLTRWIFRFLFPLDDRISLVTATWFRDQVTYAGSPLVYGQLLLEYSQLTRSSIAVLLAGDFGNTEDPEYLQCPHHYIEHFFQVFWGDPVRYKKDMVCQLGFREKYQKIIAQIPPGDQWQEFRQLNQIKLSWSPVTIRSFYQVGLIQLSFGDVTVIGSPLVMEAYLAKTPAQELMSSFTLAFLPGYTPERSSSYYIEHLQHIRTVTPNQFAHIGWLYRLMNLPNIVQILFTKIDWSQPVAGFIPALMLSQLAQEGNIHHLQLMWVFLERVRQDLVPVTSWLRSLRRALIKTRLPDSWEAYFFLWDRLHELEVNSGFIHQQIYQLSRENRLRFRGPVQALIDQGRLKNTTWLKHNLFSFASWRA